MWSCAQVVSCLLDPSADKEVPTAGGEQAVQLTSKKETGRIMGGTSCSDMVLTGLVKVTAAGNPSQGSGA